MNDFILKGGEMIRKIQILIAIGVMVCFGTGYAQNTYEDLRGRFVIDLPEGFQLEPQQDDRVYVFKKDDKSIIIEFFPSEADAGKLLKKAEGMLRISGLTDIALEGNVTEMTINTNPAQWGVYKHDMDVGSIKITLYGLVGGVSLGEAGLYYMAIVNKSDLPAWKGTFEKSFQTIRNVGQELTGVSDVKEVIVEAVAGTPMVWEHDLTTLTLPPGWTEKQLLQSFEKEVIGWFFYDPLPGTSMLAIAYKGLAMNKNKVFKAAKKTVELAIPNSKPTNAYEIKTERGKKAYIVVYMAKAVSRGTEVGLVAITATLKTDKCFLNLIGIAQSPGAKELEKQIVEIVRKAK